MGIGLSIVKSMVEMYGGLVRAHSDGPGHGATFEVRLPLARATDQALRFESVGPAPPVAAVVRRRILIVDDNADAVESIAQMLQLSGLDVRTARDGVDALRVAQDFRPDVAFLDLHMPGMGGIELAWVLRSEPWAAAVRLIALTGMGSRSDIDATTAAGFDAHLIKPAAPEEMLRLATEQSSNVVALFGDSKRGS